MACCGCEKEASKSMSLEESAEVVEMMATASNDGSYDSGLQDWATTLDARTRPGGEGADIIAVVDVVESMPENQAPTPDYTMSDQKGTFGSSVEDSPEQLENLLENMYPNQKCATVMPSEVVSFGDPVQQFFG